MERVQRSTPELILSVAVFVAVLAALLWAWSIFDPPTIDVSSIPESARELQRGPTR